MLSPFCCFSWVLYVLTSQRFREMVEDEDDTKRTVLLNWTNILTETFCKTMVKKKLKDWERWGCRLCLEKCAMCVWFTFRFLLLILQELFFFLFYSLFGIYLEKIISCGSWCLDIWNTCHFFLIARRHLSVEFPLCSLISNTQWKERRKKEDFRNVSTGLLIDEMFPLPL